MPAASIDEVIKLHDVGFRKLADAQRRDRCVFEYGLGITALLPHIQASRQVTRVAALRVRRAVERGDIAAAIHDVATVLRLARDLQPRGPVINQLVAIAIKQVVWADCVQAILAAPSLRIAHCDRLQKVLSEHEASSIDSYTEGLCAGYLTAEVTLSDLVRHQRELAKGMGLKPGESLLQAMTAIIPGLLGSPDQPQSPTSARAAAPSDAALKEMEVKLARTTPAELARQSREVGRYYRALLALAKTPYAQRIEKIAAMPAPPGDDPLSRVVRGLVEPSVAEPLTRALAREAASFRAAECLVALRRWQLTHRGSVPDLASVVREAGMKDIPADPYDGKPMRLTEIDGQPVIYSVGRDGKDDGGKVDSNKDMLPVGDLPYRLPPPQPSR